MGGTGRCRAELPWLSGLHVEDTKVGEVTAEIGRVERVGDDCQTQPSLFIASFTSRDIHLTCTVCWGRFGVLGRQSREACTHGKHENKSGSNDLSSI